MVERSLKTEVGLEVLNILINNNMLKRNLADQNIGTLLVIMNLTESKNPSKR
jgi:hypothetical protein